MRDLSRFQRLIGYSFNSESLLRQALTHRSFAVEHTGVSDNERLEFLGDAVLELVISDILFKKFPELPEGELTRMRAALVNESSLAEVAQHLEMSQVILLGKGEAKSGGSFKPSILSDALEAVLGAIYLDGGFRAAFNVIERIFDLKINQDSLDYKIGKDYKSLLQEITQARDHILPEYKVIASSGPDHSKIFIVGVWLKGDMIAEGRGKSKKEAEQHAACLAIKFLREIANG